jgi:hypothetical protein
VVRRIGKDLALAVAPLIAACSLLFQIDTPSAGPDASLPEAGSDAEDAAAAPGCPLFHWPDRPAADDPSTGDDVSLTFALRSFDLGLGDAGPAPGFDLDGLCTCPDPPSCVGVGPMCDRDGGVDNAGGELLKSLSSWGKAVWDQKLANDTVAAGRTGLLFVLHGYNGKANDISSELSIFVSDGTPPGADGGGHTPARFDGKDVWTVNPSSALGGMGPDPVYKDRNAYVAGGVLVAHVNFPLTVSGTVNLTLPLQDARIVARLINDESGARLSDGIIAARLTTGAILTALSVVEDPFVKGGHLCGDSVVYQQIKPTICDSVDLAVRPADDRTGAPCGALSIGVGFTAVQAKVGDLAPTVDGGAPCGWGYKDDCPPK